MKNSQPMMKKMMMTMMISENESFSPNAVEISVAPFSRKTMRNEVTPEFLEKIAEVMKKYDLLGSNPSKYPESIYTPVQWIMSGSFTNKRRFSVALYEPFPDEATAAILRLFREALPKEN